MGGNDSWNYSKSGSGHDPVIFTAQKLLMVIISINIDLNLFNVYVLYFHYGKASNIRLGLHGPAYCRNKRHVYRCTFWDPQLSRPHTSYIVIK